MEGQVYKVSGNMLINEYKRDLDIRCGNSKKTSHLYWFWVTHLMMKFPDATDIRAGDVLKALHQLPPGSAATFNKYLGFIKAVFNYGIKAEYLNTNPADKIQKRQEVQRIEYVKREEIKTIVRSLPDFSADVFRFLIETGLRAGEVMQIKYTDVRGEPDAYLEIRPEINKSKKSRRIPLTVVAQEIIRKRKNQDVALWSGVGDDIGEEAMERVISGDALIFPKASKYHLRCLSDRISEILGRRIRVHDLRHTFAVLCREAGVDIQDLQRLLGHASIAMTARYSDYGKIGDSVLRVDGLGT
jgi:integrase